MSKPLPLEMIRSASHQGIEELGIDPTVARGLCSAIETMGREELRKDIMPQIVESNDAPQLLSNLSYLTGFVLTHPGIKLPAAKFDSPQNRQLLREFAAKLLDSNRRLELSVAIGGSEDPPSLRLPAYLAPALDIAEAFEARQVTPPIVRIYNAFEVSTSLNGLNQATASKQAQAATNLTWSFTDSLYPYLGNSIQQDTVQFSDIAAKGHGVDSDLLLSILQLPDSQVEPQDLVLRQALDKLRRATQKHAAGCAEEADVILCGYAAAHGLTYRNYGTPETDGVIKIGGQGEAPFDVIQQQMALKKQALGTIAVTNIAKSGLPQLISLRSKAGVLPPYYLERREDGSIKELTVQSSPNQIPASLNEIIELYRQNGLRSGEDYGYLPQRMQGVLPMFFKSYLASRGMSEECQMGDTYVMRYNVLI